VVAAVAVVAVVAAVAVKVTTRTNFNQVSNKELIDNKNVSVLPNFDRFYYCQLSYLIKSQKSHKEFDNNICLF